MVGPGATEELEAGKGERIGRCGRRCVMAMAPRMRQQEGSGGLCRSQCCGT